MKKGSKWQWSTTDLTVCGVFAAMTFAASFAIGGVITATAGSGTSGFLTIIITTVLVVIGAQIVNKAGALALMVTLFTIFAIPTAMFGPPGVHKVLIGLATGIAYDLVVVAFRRTTIGYTLAGGAGAGVALVLIYQLLRFLQLPQADKLARMFMVALPVYFVLGCFGGWLGSYIYNKTLKDLAAVRNLQQTTDEKAGHNEPDADG